MDRKGKEQLKAQFADQFERSNAVILAEYRGLTVEEVTELRVKLREAGGEFKVLKNRVAKKAIEEKSAELAEKLTGPLGAVYSFGDSAQVTKTTLDFAKDHPKFVVTVGHMEGTLVSEKDLKAIADLPSKEVLMAQIIGSLVSPHRGLLSVLNGVSRNLVQVINAIKDKKE